MGSIVGAGYDDFATGIVVDSNDDVYVTGAFEGMVDFDRIAEIFTPWTARSWMFERQVR